MRIQRHDITGVVLTGGQGQRMGGADKGWLLFHGEPLIVHAIRRLEHQVGALLISANRELQRYQALGYQVVSDDKDAHGTTPYAGPLAGVLVAMRACKTPWMITIPCDSPQLPGDLAARMVSSVLQANPMPFLATATTPSTKSHTAHPVFSLLHCRLQPRLADYLRSGGRSMRQWQAQEGALQVPFEDAAAFTNLNTLQDLAALQSRCNGIEESYS
jgi:molybdopterin-guanine dinucleotide biosynthesis protein A